MQYIKTYLILIIAGVLSTLALQNCESIDPLTELDDLGEDAVQLTCEKCHTNRTYLIKLAVPGEDATGGGG